MVDYEAVTPLLGNLIGICPICEALMYRRVNPEKLPQALGTLTIAAPEGVRHIGETAEPTVNSDLRHEAATHDPAQRQ